MSKVRVSAFSLSLDGYGAGPSQDLQNPLGVGGPELFDWFFRTRTWRTMHGNEGGETGVDDDMAARGFAGLGAWVLGRNMFGPIRGPWPDESWRGWWGEEPPYHTPVFVLTHHARAPLKMAGGTEFRFVTGGIEDALRQARAAAGGKDIRIGGGVATIRQYLLARLVDELHLVISPVLMGKGEHLLQGIDMRSWATRSRRWSRGHGSGARHPAKARCDRRRKRRLLKARGTMTRLVHNYMAAWRLSRWRWALLIAAASDALGFALALLPLAQWLLDAVTVAALLFALGFRWQLLAALAVEVVPALELFPAWTLVVLAMSATTTQGSPDGKGRPDRLTGAARDLARCSGTDCAILKVRPPLHEALR